MTNDKESQRIFQKHNRFSKKEQNMKSPANTNLPYFDYGLFKPGELAFKKIADFLNASPEHYTINGLFLWLRDGVPLLGDHYYGTPVSGVILRFQPKNASQAYEIISEFAGWVQYEWNTLHLTVNKIAVNVLWGKQPEKGSDRIIGDNWTVKNDPIFDSGMALVRQTIEKYGKEFFREPFNWERLFKLQMAYLLLWVAIERYCYFRYGLAHEPHQKLSDLSNDIIFQDALQEVLKKNSKFGCERVVYDSRALDKDIRLKADKPCFSLQYYYIEPTHKLCYACKSNKL